MLQQLPHSKKAITWKCILRSVKFLQQTCAQKVNLLKEIRDSATATAVNMLTNKARVFVATVVDPILGCLENDYGNDLDQFSNKRLVNEHQVNNTINV
jgi:hypothetical protein